MQQISMPLKALPMELDESFTPVEAINKILFKLNESIVNINNLYNIKLDKFWGTDKAGYFLKVGTSGEIEAVEGSTAIAYWGSVLGNIQQQTDLINLLNTKINTSDIANDLITQNPLKVLSAYQGYVLKGLIDTINTAIQTINTTIGTWTSSLGADIATAISNIQGNITTLGNAIQTINSTLGTYATSIQAIQTTIGRWTSSLGADIATAIRNLQTATASVVATIGTWTSSLGADIATAIRNLQEEVQYLSTIHAGTINYNTTYVSQSESESTIYKNNKFCSIAGVIKINTDMTAGQLIGTAPNGFFNSEKNSYIFIYGGSARVRIATIDQNGNIRCPYDPLYAGELTINGIYIV